METTIERKDDKNEMILGIILFVVLVTFIYLFLAKKSLSNSVQCQKILGEFSPLSNL